MDSNPEKSPTDNIDMVSITPSPSSPHVVLDPPFAKEASVLADGSNENSDTTSSDVIRKIPKPHFPIRVFTGEPPPFSLEAQRAIMRWSHERRHFLPDPYWLKEPCIDHIKDTVWPYLEQLGADYKSIWVEFLAEGGFNRVYTVHTVNKVTKHITEYVFRIALPVDPYFKTESEVATTEIVRHFTNIPVPIIYAYDSSTANALGLEWILMEKIVGKKLEETWESLDYETKLRLTKTITSWTVHLSKINSNMMGNVYMRYTETDLEFYVGRSVHHVLSQENRLTYDGFRGPFKSLEEYYAAVLNIADQDVLDLTQAFNSGSFKFEPTPGRPKRKGTFLDQSVFYYLEVDDEDKTDEEWEAEQRQELKILSTGIKQLRAALPRICAKAPETSGTLSTYLAHDDLSRRNIFVDDAGTPVALLDWEALPMKPLLFLTNPPEFIQSYDYEYDEPVLDSAENEKRYERLGYSEEEKQRCRETSAEYYAEKIEEYTCTKLRRVHQEELERIGSPLAKAVWDDYFFLDRQLLKRVVNTSQNVDDLVEWTEAMLAMDEESEDEEEDEEETNEEGDNNRDGCEYGDKDGDTPQLGFVLHPVTFFEKMGTFG